MPRYTPRKNGKNMVDVKLTQAVSQDVVVWLAKHMGCTEAAALKEIKKTIQCQLSDAVCWHTYVVDKSKSVQIVHVDDSPEWDPGERWDRCLIE